MHTGTPFAFRADGWFNMTKAAQHFGKRLDKFFSTDETFDYLEELERLNPTKKGEYLEATRGRYGGTWAHPKLAVFFARWLDVRFAVWCDALHWGLVYCRGQECCKNCGNEVTSEFLQQFCCIV